MMMKRMVAILLSVLTLGALVCACGTPKQEYKMDVAATYDKIAADCGLGSMQALDDTTLSTLYPDMPIDKLTAHAVYIALINVRADEVAIFEAKDADAAAEVKTAVAGRKAALEEQWSMYLPDQYELVKNAAIEVYGNYVVFIVGEYAEQAMGIVKDALGVK